MEENNTELPPDTTHADGIPRERSEPDWYVRSVAHAYHMLDLAIRKGLQQILGLSRLKERPKLPTKRLLVILAIIIAGIVISYNAPRNVGSEFWIGGLSLNTVVAGGFLAFAPWLQDRVPDIMIAMVSEAVDAGLAKWGDGLTSATARDSLGMLTVSNRVWMSVGMTASGLVMLTFNLAAFAIMVWLPLGARIGVTSALIALMIYVVVNVAAGLSIIRTWPVIWKAYDALKEQHNKFNPCPICTSEDNKERWRGQEVFTIERDPIRTPAP